MNSIDLRTTRRIPATILIRQQTGISETHGVDEPARDRNILEEELPLDRRGALPSRFVIRLCRKKEEKAARATSSIARVAKLPFGPLNVH